MINYHDITRNYQFFIEDYSSYGDELAIAVGVAYHTFGYEFKQNSGFETWGDLAERVTWEAYNQYTGAVDDDKIRILSSFADLPILIIPREGDSRRRPQITRGRGVSFEEQAICIKWDTERNKYIVLKDLVNI